MTGALLRVFAGLLMASTAGATVRADEPSTIESLLRSVGIEPRDVGIHTADLALFVGSRPRSEFVHLLMTEPLRADDVGYVLADLLHNPNAKNPSEQKTPADLLGAMSRFNTRAVRRGLVGDPLEKHKAAAKEKRALETVLTQIGGKSVSRSKLDKLPASVQESAALLLLTAIDAAKWVERSRDPRRLPRAYWKQIEKTAAEPLKTGKEADEEEPDPDHELQLKYLVENFQSQKVMVAAQDLTLATMAAVKSLRADATLADAKFYLRMRTDLGMVVIADAANHKHRYGAPLLLLLDIGGDDEYAAAGANAGSRYPVSIAIDLAGNDTYKAEPNQLGSFGAGTFGVGILWDEAGNDTYEADRRSQGAGEFGVGVLVDNAGDDVYKSIETSQASATAGYGLLIDGGGKDRYEAHQASQAFAGPNAAALLVDRGGDDEYIANDEDILYPSAQSDKHNTSMCQGAADGWRADYKDGISLNGGMAVLLDVAGDDKYTCGVFGQGVGYWYGAGLLIDLAGKDSYLGQWYVQGASAHFAAGLLFDRDGDDQYTAYMNMSQGAGHDIGIGVLIDDAGNDTYHGSSLGLGASNAAGVGLFIDKAGDDKYQTPAGGCLGWVNANRGYRSLFRSYGLFFDLGGTDTYSGRSDAADTSRWTTPPDPKARVPYMFGYAFDR